MVEVKRVYLSICLICRDEASNLATGTSYCSDHTAIWVSLPRSLSSTMSTVNEIVMNGLSTTILNELANESANVNVISTNGAPNGDNDACYCCIATSISIWSVICSSTLRIYHIVALDLRDSVQLDRYVDLRH